jgi:hypothetical protein
VRHGGSSIMISGRARSGWPVRPGSRSRRWPGIWASNEGTLGNWVNADRRHRGEGNGALGEDERAELARLRRPQQCAGARPGPGRSSSGLTALRGLHLDSACAPALL